MGSEFTYCQNPNADVPKMFIDTQIGDTLDENGNIIVRGVDGNLFARELYAISDTLGKKNIEVWINSEGGLVKEGMSIYSAILDVKANVDTVCYGMAASIAGVFFQAGRKRKMLDYANLMYHEPFRDDGSKDGGLSAISDSICKMISTRSGKDEAYVSGMMAKETWMSADEALANGFCDEIIASDEKNKKRMSTAITTNAKWQVANAIVNRTNEKKNTMRKVNNKLGLVDDANEDSQVAAIEKIKNDAAAAITKVKNEMTEAENKSKTLEDENKTLKAELEKMKKEKNDADEAAKAKAEAEAKNAAEVAVKAAVDAGKIKNEATVIAEWKNTFIANPDTAKKLLDAIPPTKRAATFNAAAPTTNTTDTEAESAARRMGLKPGSAAWYNAIKMAELNMKK